MVGFLGCAALFPPAERPACGEAALAQIEAAYVAEILEACEGQHFDTCVERVKIDKRYDVLREEWVECR